MIRPQLVWPILLPAALAIAVLASFALGAEVLRVEQVWAALAGAPLDVESGVIVRNLRVPRTLLALVVGGTLGVAGILLQSLTRNPLAEPGLFGINAGAAFAIVVAAAAGLAPTVGISALWALLGAAGAGGVLMSVFASGSPTLRSPVTLALIGVALTAVLVALTSAVSLLFADSLDAYRFWIVGSLAQRGINVLVQVLPLIVIGLLLALVSARGLDQLALGDDLAHSLGVNAGRIRVVGVISVGLLVAAAVAACGPLSFVGLMVAHLGRALVGMRHMMLIPVCAILGATVLTSADVIGRVLVPGRELQTGVVLGLVGGPLFVYFAARRKVSL